jgi:hypothetical protein
VAFLEQNQHKLVFLDIILNDAQAREMGSPEPEEGGRKRYFFALPDDWNNPRLGGTSVHMLVSPGDDFFFDARPESPRVSGYFKIIGSSGPQMGYFVHVLRPVNIEEARAGGAQ